MIEHTVTPTLDELRAQIEKLKSDKSWDVLKENCEFFMRGTVRDLARADLSPFDDGREFVFVMLRPEGGV